MNIMIYLKYITYFVPKAIKPLNLPIIILYLFQRFSTFPVNLYVPRLDQITFFTYQKRIRIHVKGSNIISLGTTKLYYNITVECIKIKLNMHHNYY